MELREGYKQTDDGLIPEDWIVTQLGFIGQFKNGINKGRESFGHGNPFVNLLDVFGKNFILMKDSFGLVDSSNHERSNYDLKEGDVIFIRSSVKPSGVGLTAVVLEDLPQTVYSGFLIRFRDNGKIESNYKKYCFYEERFRNKIISASSVSANTNINQDNLKRLTLSLPPTKTEQTAIANALSDTDAWIQSLTRLIEKKQLIKQGAMQALLNPYENGCLKEGWVEKKIGSFTNASSGGTPSTLVPSFWNGDINWMSSGELNHKKIYKVSGRITNEGLNNSATKIIPKKCVLIGLAGQGKTRGTAAINYIDLCTNQSIAAIYPCKTVSSEFLYFNLDGRYDELRSLSTGDSGRGGLNLTIIKNIDVWMPRKYEHQKQVANILTNIDDEITALETKLTKAKKIKQGMMQNLLTGKIRLINQGVVK